MVLDGNLNVKKRFIIESKICFICIKTQSESSKMTVLTVQTVV